MSHFVTSWTAAHQASLSITNSWSLLKLMSIELVMPSNHLILSRPLPLLPSIFPSLRVFPGDLIQTHGIKYHLYSDDTLATCCEELTHFKDTDAGKDWRQEEKGTTEDEMIGWHHQLNEHEFEQTSRASERQGSLVCCSSWGHRLRHDLATEQKQMSLHRDYVQSRDFFSFSVELWIHDLRPPQ